NAVIALPGDSSPCRMRTSFAMSAPADGWQKRDLVAIRCSKHRLVGQYGAIERELDLLTAHGLAQRTRQRVEEALPVDGRRHVLFWRTREIGQLAEKDQRHRHC